MKPIWLLIMAVPFLLFADEEAANFPVVAADETGRLYAKSTSTADYGDNGKTMVFLVGNQKDSLLWTYSWYSSRIYLHNGWREIVVIRLGPWPRGSEANKNQLAVGFYKDGKVLQEYSTLDIAGAPDNVERSVSHYTVIKSVDGLRPASGSGNSLSTVFKITKIDGKAILFDVRTGRILKQ